MPRYISHAKDRIDQKYLTKEVENFHILQMDWNTLVEGYFSTHHAQEKDSFLASMREMIASTGMTFQYKSSQISPQELYLRRKELYSHLYNDHGVAKEFHEQYDKTIHTYNKILTNVLDVVEVTEEFESIHAFVKTKAELLGLFQDDMVEFDVVFDKQVYHFAHEQVFIGKVRLLTGSYHRQFMILGVLSSKKKSEYYIKKIYSVHKIASDRNVQ